MNHEDIFIGMQCRVDSIGTNSREVWTVKGLSQNKVGQWEVNARGSKTPFARTFLAEQIEGVATKMSKKIVSESTEVVGEILGLPMYVEEISYMPHQERRGRKAAE